MTESTAFAALAQKPATLGDVVGLATVLAASLGARASQLRVSLGIFETALATRLATRATYRGIMPAHATFFTYHASFALLFGVPDDGAIAAHLERLVQLARTIEMHVANIVTVFASNFWAFANCVMNGSTPTTVFHIVCISQNDLKVQSTQTCPSFFFFFINPEINLFPF